MGTSNSGTETRERARKLAKKIGSYHTDLNIDGIIASFLTLLFVVTQKTPCFKVHGGTNTENLALQNVQVKLI
jgi:NAD+ synthase (glutamine-hydrolysing)